MFDSQEEIYAYHFDSHVEISMEIDIQTIKKQTEIILLLDAVIPKAYKNDQKMGRLKS